METQLLTTPGRVRQFVHQVSRFGLVGFLNTAIDLLAFNLLLWLLPTRDTRLLLLYNVLAQCIAALNSFCLNKWWTFGNKQPITGQQVTRFIAVVGVCFLCNLPLNWLFTSLFVASSLTSPFWMNVAKISALAGTAMLSFLAMRVWTFATGKA
jgi:putative flippase GtrA